MGLGISWLFLSMHLFNFQSWKLRILYLCSPSKTPFPNHQISADFLVSVKLIIDQKKDFWTFHHCLHLWPYLFPSVCHNWCINNPGPKEDPFKLCTTLLFFPLHQELSPLVIGLILSTYNTSATFLILNVQKHKSCLLSHKPSLPTIIFLEEKKIFELSIG